jgi:S1-C subfamily serine protease
VRIWRQGQQQEFEVEARVFPLRKGPDLAYQRTGLRVESIAAARKRFGRKRVPAESGAVVTAIRKNSTLARSGVRPGDTIRRIDDLSIADPEDFYRAVVRSRKKETIVVLLQRKAQRYFITIRMGRSNSTS